MNSCFPFYKAHNDMNMKRGYSVQNSPLFRIDVFLDSLLHGHTSEGITLVLSNGILGIFVHVCYDRSAIRPGRCCQRANFVFQIKALGVKLISVS